MDEWTSLKTGKEVFDRQAEGWEVEVKDIDEDWIPWRGSGWHAGNSYRGRPRPQAVVYECYDIDSKLYWFKAPINVPASWTRIPQFDKIVEAAE